jgi:4-hydroxybenzoyl-CoA thioesterase
MTFTEAVMSTQPFTVRRRVRFGACDPAGVAYTAQFSEYAVSAMDLFLSELLDGPYLKRLGTVQTPIKALSFVFLAPLRPNDEFDMVVSVREIRTHTFVLGIDGAMVSGTPIFECVMAPICISSTRRSVAIPAKLRAALTTYQQQAGANDATALPH